VVTPREESGCGIIIGCCGIIVCAVVLYVIAHFVIKFW
jgi:hypothetical protein